MIISSEIPPSPALAPYIRCYKQREFDTKGLDLIRPWEASHELSLVFHFKSLPNKLINPNTGQILTGGSYGGILGMGTQYNGEITLNGCFSIFEILFKPTGFHELFQLPSGSFNNYLVYADDIFDSGIKIFYEQLCMAKGLSEMASLADEYLLCYLKKQKQVGHKDTITSLSDIILKAAGIINIDRLAYDANMSFRNFERRFIEQVGVSPKLFCCITRFNNALLLKLKNPKKDWTSIAHESGYFDQMHLIKDFKRFSGNTPSGFLKQSPLAHENYTNRVEV